ncbi:MAG: hypothetical protein EHM81_00680 [Chloroflexi bacterium]|nr:MAG: hypothetical protein EHM81_00680 [Chloroflexota bacterium]
MIKKIVNFFATIFIIFGMLAFASPTSAAPAAITRNITGGRILASSLKTKTLLVKPVKGQAVQVKAKAATMIYRQGIPVGFAKLRVGDKINVTYNTGTGFANNMAAKTSIYEIHGSVEAVNKTAKTVTVNSEEGGDSVVLKVNSSTVITRRGAIAIFDDLVVGDKVEAKYNSATMIASRIKVETEDGEIHGTIAAVNVTGKTVTITPELGGADVTLNISFSTVIKRGKAVTTLAKLQVGDRVEAKYDSATMVASVIEAEYEGGEIHGTIAAVDTAGNAVTITPALGGTNITLVVDAKTVILRNDLPAALSDLAMGEKVEARYNASTMIASLIKSEMEDGEIHGTIAAVDTVAKTLIITPLLGGANVVINIGPSTVILRNLAPATLADLLVGEKVEAKYDTATMVASLVKSETEDGELKGTIAAVDTVANTMTILPQLGGANVVINIGPSTVILRNLTPVTLADLLVGEKVEAKYDSATMIASLVKSETEDGELKGTIAAVNTVANTVTITPKLGGADVVINIAPSTVILRNLAPATLANLVAGDKIEVKYNSATMIASLVKAEL